MNSHGSPHTPLKRARLPISPLVRCLFILHYFSDNGNIFLQKSYFFILFLPNSILHVAAGQEKGYSRIMIKKALMLFINTFTISMTANSGYAIIGVMKNRFVEKYGWFTREEMNNYIAMAQSCPGPMAVSSSMIIGYQSAGFLGAFAAVLGVIIPPFVMMIVVTYFYTFIATNVYVRIFITGMQAGVCALLMDVILGLFEGIVKMNSWFYYLLVVLFFLFVRLTDFSVFLLAILCILIAVVKTLLFTKRMEEAS